jgi:L-ascorbate metabolism protein UlaG (beta-lactamase superfamily)
VFVARIAWIACAIVAVSLGTALAGPPAAVTYVANEGFLIEVGGKKILIDAIFDDRTITYAHVPDDRTLSLMRASSAPFDEIDLVLVTHSHRDHFSAEPVLEHLAASPSGILVAPPQAVEQLQEVEPDFQEMDFRVREVDLGLFESQAFDVGGIRVTATRLRHSAYIETDPETGEQRNRHEHVENLVYLVELEGFTMLHVGDAVLPQNLELFEEGRFSKRAIDVVFLEFFDWTAETKAILDQWMTPDHVVFMHLPPEKEKIRQIEARLLETFPNAIVFAEPMDKKQL